MSSRTRHTAGWICAPVLILGAPQSDRLVFEEVLRVELGAADAIELSGFGRARILELVALRDGPITILVESADADVLVRCVDIAGEPLAEDDDGGIEWNSRLVVDGVAGEMLNLVAGFKASADGALRIVAHEGVAPQPAGSERDAARTLFFLDQGRSALARGKKLDAIDALNSAGQLEFALGRFASCRQTYTTVLSLANEIDHALSRTVAEAHLGAVHLQFGELADARTVLERALASAVELRQEVVEMFVQSKLGGLYLASGDHASAREAYERALAVSRGVGDRANEVLLCSAMGAVAWHGGDGDQALSWHDRAVASARTLGAPAPLAEALRDAGRFHGECAQYRLARAKLEEAQAIATTPRLEASVLGELGHVALRTGDVLGAAARYERVLAAARELGDAELEVAALLGLAQTDDLLGDVVRARGRLEGALTVLHGAGAPRVRAEILRTLARVLTETRALDAARAPLEQALELARRVDDRPLEALVLSEMVVWRYRRGEFAQAVEPARRQLAIGRELRLPDVEAVALDNLAELSIRTGDLASARALSEQALTIYRQLGDPRYLQSALLKRVEIVQKEGDAAAMADVVREAEACFEHIDVARLDPEQASLVRAQDVFALWGEYSQDLVALACAAPDRAPESERAHLDHGFRRAGLWKSRGLLQGIAEHRSGVRNAETIERRRERRETLAEREAVLGRMSAMLRQDPVPSARIEELRGRVAELARRADELSAELRRLAPADAGLDLPEGVSPGELARVLGEADILVEFVDGRHRLYAYVLQKGVLSFRDIGSRDAIDARVTEYLADVSQPARRASVSDIARRGRELYAELLAPLLTRDVAARLIVVPTASLSMLPFEALVVHAPDHPASFAELVFVLDRHEVCYAASTPVLKLLSEVGPRQTAGPALILADPIFPMEATAQGASRGDSWPRLQGSRSEAIAVAAALDPTRADVAQWIESKRSASLCENAFELYVGADATPERMRKDLRRYAIIHCASHGWVDLADPRNSGLVLSASGNEDGILSVSEILELDLDADLAVLSACETGRGAVRRGEGVQSMARAFLYAGARTVVASLWQVDDRATAQVMRSFYAESIGRREPPSAALRAARLEMRRGGASTGELRGVGVGDARAIAAGDVPVGHPYYWAAFVCFGLPRPAAVSSK